MGNTLLRLTSACFTLAVDAMMAFMRFMGWAYWVPRSTRLMEAWLFSSLLFSSRRLTGMAAISGLRGMLPCCAR